MRVWKHCIKFCENLCQNHCQNPIIVQINVNSIRNKFDKLVPLVTFYIDILMILETKIDESFPLPQLMSDGWVLYALPHWNAHAAGILVYFRNNITAKLLKLENLPLDKLIWKLKPWSVSVVQIILRNL